ncbi:MAG TPA: hypothetical protein VFV64_04805 [Permianibacter sp.]|nr:hypothetical protein [Permianibacter sp.]
MFDSFKARFGQPEPESGLGPQALVPAREALQQFEQEVGTGRFADGWVSVCSSRELCADCGGWERYLPAGACLIASTAFGFLLWWADDAVWLIDTQHGQVMASDLSLSEALLRFAEPEFVEAFLHPELWHAWREQSGLPLATTAVLCPVPMLALGGSWPPKRWAQMTMPVYLSFTFQLFADQNRSAIQLHTQ